MFNTIPDVYKQPNLVCRDRFNVKRYFINTDVYPTKLLRLAHHDNRQMIAHDSHNGQVLCSNTTANMG